jgi:hypothetical protein
MGWGAVINKVPPEFNVDVDRAFHCWRFCNGYRPELLPMYAAIYGLPDPEKMIELLMQIRDGR